MLDDRGGGLIELLDQLPGRVQIHQVVVGKLLALELLGAGDSAAAVRIQRGLLMRILAVPQIQSARRANVQERRQPRLLLDSHRCQPRADGAIVRRRQRERLLRQPPVRRFRQPSLALVQLLQDGRIVVRRSDHRDVLIILGGRADQRRAADVDVLDQLGHVHTGLGRDLLEGIQVHHHHVDGSDFVLGQRLHVFGVSANRQNAPCDPRIDGFQTAIQHLWKPSELGNLAHPDARFLNRPGGPAGGDDLHAQAGQTAGEIYNAALIGNTDQRTLDCTHSLQW